jgi:hypothetical protein
MERKRAPVSDEIIIAVAELVDDSQTGSREPTHSDLEFYFNRCGVSAGDPKSQGQVVGKAKRVRAVLSWGYDNAPEKAEMLVLALVSLVRAKGGFRSGSNNFVGEERIIDAQAAFRSEGYVLASDGELYPAALDSMGGVELTDALQAYVKRAQRGSEDAALLVGTGKDLLEATAAHVIEQRFGAKLSQPNFPTLLGQAFTALGLATPHDAMIPGEPPQRRIERALYEAGCAINALRNKTGTGHGRPFLPTLPDEEARAAVQMMGIISGLLLRTLKKTP